VLLKIKKTLRDNVKNIELDEESFNQNPNKTAKIQIKNKNKQENHLKAVKM
jgi:hypothetical protein